MERIYRLLELAWLAIAAGALVTAIIIYFFRQPEESYLFFSLAPIALVMYYLRRRQRARFIKKNSNQNPQ